MITNAAELEVVRKQLARVEAALDSLRQEVKPKSEANYALMSESYVEMLTSLRAEIDAFTRIAPGSLDRTYSQADGVIRSLDK
jgi:hypothetical protein